LPTPAIAATTWSEYRQYIEKDPALTALSADPGRRAGCGALLRYAARHSRPDGEAPQGARLRCRDCCGAVTLSSRYIPARQLPDRCTSGVILPLKSMVQSNTIEGMDRLAHALKDTARL
jgi:hypothetical protein